MAGLLQYHLPDVCRMTGMDAATHNADGVADTAFVMSRFDGGRKSLS